MDLQATALTPSALSLEPILRAMADATFAFNQQDAAATSGRPIKNIGRDLSMLERDGLIETRDDTKRFWISEAGRAALRGIDASRLDWTPPTTAEGGVSTGVHADFDRNPKQPRKRFNQEKLEQLADTIEEVGILEPIVTWPKNDAGRRIIWAGERRWRAAGIVNQRYGDPNRVRIPYIEREPTEAEQAALEAEAAKIALIENGQGEDLTSYEKATALRSMVPTLYPSARAAAKVIGVHEKTAQDWLKALAELPAEVLKCWEADELGWREVRDILRPAPAKVTEADPAQIDIEEVTGAEQGVPASLLSDFSRDQALADHREPADPLDRAEYFSEAVQEAALAEARAGGSLDAVQTRLSGRTTIEGEYWPKEPSEVLVTPWEGYPRVKISLTCSDRGRWFVALSTNAGGPRYQGSSSPPYVYSGDPIFRSREDALAYADDRAVTQLGEWGQKRKLRDWLSAIAGGVAPPAPAPSSAQVAADAKQDWPTLSGSERVALIEATHKALTQNAAQTGRAAQVGAYWLDAGCSRLKDLGLLTFVQAGGELGWCVMWGEKAYAWFRANVPEFFDASGELKISEAQLALAQAEVATMEWTGPTWTGPGYVTPWLNGFTGASKVTPDGIVRYLADDTPVETDPETEADAVAEDARAAELLQGVVDRVESPEALPALFAATGVKLPLKVGTGADLGVIFDADGAAILTVDQDNARPNAWVAAVALLVAAAVEDAADDHEVTGAQALKWSVIPPEKFKPADMRRSITPWAIVCLEDGRSFTSLKRHLQTVHGLSWDEYLTKWGLPLDYPSVAPATAQVRSDAAWAVLQGLPK